MWKVPEEAVLEAGLRESCIPGKKEGSTALLHVGYPRIKAQEHSTTHHPLSPALPFQWGLCQATHSHKPLHSSSKGNSYKIVKSPQSLSQSPGSITRTGSFLQQ